MLLSSRHWLSVGLSQLFILMPTQILLAQNASGEGIAAEAPSGFLAILFSGGIVGAIMILLLLLIGPDHPPTTDDSIPLGGIRTVVGCFSLLIPIVCFPPLIFRMT